MNDAMGPVRECADALAERFGDRAPAVGVVLGSGLAALTDALADAEETPFSQVPGLAEPTVEGHAGRVLVGSVGGVRTVMLAGRTHLYEGRAPAEVVLPVRALALAGVGTLVLTNAAGAVSDRAWPGDVVLLADHLNLTGANPLVGENEEDLGERFPTMAEVYSPRLRSLARETAGEIGIELPEGVYAGVLGPSFETPAEVRMLRTLGADVVGMSTVLEAIAARHAGMEVLGLSLVANAAGAHEISHDEVLETTSEAARKVSALLAALLPKTVPDG